MRDHVSFMSFVGVVHFSLSHSNVSRVHWWIPRSPTSQTRFHNDQPVFLETNARTSSQWLITYGFRVPAASLTLTPLTTWLVVSYNIKPGLLPLSFVASIDKEEYCLYLSGAKRFAGFTLIELEAKTRVLLHGGWTHAFFHTQFFIISAVGPYTSLEIMKVLYIV